MSETPVPVRTSRTSFTRDGRILYQFHLVPTRSMNYDEFLAAGAEKTGMNKLKFRHAWESAWSVIINNLAKGVGTNASAVHVSLKIIGSALAANAKPDPKVNKLLPQLLAKGELAEAVLGLEAVNVTVTIEAVLYAVEQEGAGAANILTAAGQNIVATGRNILTESTDDTGVYLLNAAGSVLKTATIARTDTDSIEFSFATLPENGEYTLAILTRNGQDAEEYGVTQLERKVTVNVA